MKIVRWESTPNPNAQRLWLDVPAIDPQGPPQSYFDAVGAQGTVLGKALFAVSGVCNVLIKGDWITVGKRPDADWKAVKSGVSKAIAPIDGFGGERG